MQVRGRYLVIGWTAVFLAAVGAIVLRDGAGFAARKRVDSTGTHIKTLEGVRADLETATSLLQGREQLAAKVQAFGLRFATDSELVPLRLPARH